MQAQVKLMSTTRQKLITAAVAGFLAATSMAPMANATSIAPEEELASGEASAQSSDRNPEMIRDEIKFIEENWYSHVAYDEAGDNPASVEPGTDDQADEHRPQGVEEFEAMERAPGLYTESSDAASPAREDAVDPQGVEEFEAMERAPGLYTESPDAGSPARDDAVDAGLPHDDAVKFLENNWHLSFDIVNVEDDEGDVTTGSASPDGNNTDRADTLDELQNEAGEADDERSHDELTYPWGGFRENH